MNIRSFYLLALSAVLFVSSGTGCKKSEPSEVTTNAVAMDAAPSKVVVADANTATKPVKDEVKKLAQPFFYKVEGPKGEVGHFLGTMHMGIDAEKELPDYVWKVIDAAKVVSLEADISDPSLAMGLMLPKDTNLRKELGEETWKLLEEAIGKQMAQMLMPMKPAAAASMLAIKDLPQTMPMDLLLLNKAKAKSLELAYLETGKFQLDLLTKIMTADFLGEMLRDPEASNSAKLLQVYRDGDEKAMSELMLDPKAWGSAKMSKSNMDAMLFARNRNWIPQIESLLAKKTALIAVGAAHLMGKDSVLDLLEKKGYTITRVSE